MDFISACGYIKQLFIYNTKIRPGNAVYLDIIRVISVEQVKSVLYIRIQFARVNNKLLIHAGIRVVCKLYLRGKSDKTFLIKSRRL